MMFLFLVRVGELRFIVTYAVFIVIVLNRRTYCLFRKHVYTRYVPRLGRPFKRQKKTFNLTGENFMALYSEKVMDHFTNPRNPQAPNSAFYEPGDRLTPRRQPCLSR